MTLVLIALAGLLLLVGGRVRRPALQPVRIDRKR